MIFCCSIPGAAVLKVVNRKNSKFVLSSYALLIPLTGAASIMIIAQFSSLLLTMNQFALLYPILFLFSIYVLRNNIVSGCKKIIQNYKAELTILFLMTVFLLYPVFSRQELGTYQYVNNDGMFYLSTISWLKEHTLLEVSTFSGKPFYDTALYIFKSTRFGLDTLGAFFASLFNKESHEILSILGASAGVMSAGAIAYFLKYTFKMPKWPQMVGLCLIGFNFGWIDLMIKQYMPQIMGIGCLVSFIFLLLRVFQTNKLSDGILAGIFLNATASSYAEFSSYMGFIFLIFMVIFFFYQPKGKGKFKYLKAPIFSGIFSIIVNPVGFFVAVRFYLNFIKNTEVGSYGNFDAYGGNMMPWQQWISKSFGSGYLYGGSAGFENLGKYLFIYIILIVIAVFVVVFLLYMIIKNKNVIDICLLSIILLFFVIAVNFRISKFAYGEFKHISSFFAIFLMASIYVIYTAISQLKSKKYIGNTIGILLSICVLCFSLYSSLKAYSIPLFFYGENVKELHQAAQLIPATEPIAIDTGDVSAVHRMIYGVQDHTIILVHPSQNSYYNWPLYDRLPRYVVYDKSRGTIETDIEGSVIWANDTFMLVDRDGQ